MSIDPSGPPEHRGDDLDESSITSRIPRSVLALLPIILIAIVLVGLLVASPAFDRGDPQPELTVSYHTIPDGETVVLHATNDGAQEITIAQLFADEAYWNFHVEKTNHLPLIGSGDGPNTLAPGESAKITIPYHLTLDSDAEVEFDIILEDGDTFSYDIEGVQTTAGFGIELIWTLGLIGLFVGVIPVAIGMLWFPFFRTMSDRWLFAILAFAAGVLAYLAIASTFEAFELSERIPGTYAGEALIVVGILASWLLVQAVSEWRKGDLTSEQRGLWIAYLVAIGIGLHNLAEGLAIGGAYSLGEMSLAVFLIVGFMLHNVTEGPAVVAPLARDDRLTGRRPALHHFVAIGAIAGVPVIFGGWIGGLSLSPTVGAFFLAIGAGAILQVIWELIQLVRDGGGRAASSRNLLAFLIGVGIMYATALFIPL